MNDYTKWFWEAMAKELTAEQLETMKSMVTIEVSESPTGGLVVGVQSKGTKPRRKKRSGF